MPPPVQDVKPRELEEVLRLEYRSKLLNPRWESGMERCWGVTGANCRGGAV